MIQIRKLTQVKAGLDDDSKSSQESMSTSDSDKLRPSGRLSRLQPKTGRRAERRRRKLQRLRRTLRQDDDACANDSATNPVRQPHRHADDGRPATDPATTESKRNDREKKRAKSEGSSRARPSTNERRRSRRRPKDAVPPKADETPRPQTAGTSIPERIRGDQHGPEHAENPHPAEHAEETLCDSDVAGVYRVIEPPEPPHEAYGDWFRRVVVKNRWMTWFTTFYLHWVILLVMAAILVHGPENAASLILNATVADEHEPEPRPFEIVSPLPRPVIHKQAESSPAVPDAEQQKLNEDAISLNSSIVDALSPAEVPEESAVDSATSTTQQTQTENRLEPIPPATPVDAVTEGSFSVWTEPSQPLADKPYRIIIQVRLPENIRQYDLSDLEGVVVGSDGYRKPIPGSLAGSLPIDNGYARFVVPIVSADTEVRDTVLIRSKLLKESQKLVLQF